MQIDLSPELEKQVGFWADKSHEKTDEPVKRLIKEYVDNFRNNEDFFSKTPVNISDLYASAEVSDEENEEILHILESLDENDLEIVKREFLSA